MIGFIWPINWAPQISEENNGREVIVLVHGIGSCPVMMKPLQRRLESEKTKVIAFGYSSVLRGLDVHARRLGELLSELDADPNVDKIHIVTHSMGGVITRCVLMQEQPEKLGRVVMIAPPHHGSPVATFFARLVGWWISPLWQISEKADSYVNQLGPLKGIDFGVIAGAQDQIVALESTRLEGQRDHITAPGTHCTLTTLSSTAELVRSYLSDGEFDRAIVEENELAELTMSFSVA